MQDRSSKTDSSKNTEPPRAVATEILLRKTTKTLLWHSTTTKNQMYVVR
jgi:hypothetical protein